MVLPKINLKDKAQKDLMDCKDIYVAAEACICLSFYEDALKFYERYIELCDSQDPAAWHGLANALEELNRQKEALEAYRKAYQLYKEDDWSSSLWKGWCAMKLGRYEEALRLFQLSVEKKEDYPYAYQSLALALLKLGKKDEAKEVLKKFKEVNKAVKYKERACEGYEMLKQIKDSQEIEGVLKKAEGLAKNCSD